MLVIRERSYLYSGKEQIVIQKFAEALEVIPLTIARNAGMNTIDIGTHLREKSIQSSLKEKKKETDMISKTIVIGMGSMQLKEK